MSRRKKDPALEQEGFKRKLYCWMRQRRAALAAHKVLYYDRSEPILEDLQFDYVESQLIAVEKRHPDISAALKGEGYLSPSDYVDALRLPEIEKRADQMLSRWKEQGRPRPAIPAIGPYMTPDTLYRDALQSIVQYPI